MTTIHAYTGTQSLVVARVVKIYALHVQRQKISFPHYRCGKSHWSGDPRTERQTEGHAQRVPVKTGSVTELVSILEKK